MIGHASSPADLHDLRGSSDRFRFLFHAGVCARVGGILAGGILHAAAAAAATHDKDFWRAIVKADYAVPANEQISPLARELSTMLGSPDPELRDEFGYTILAAWIFQKRLIEPARSAS